MQGREARESRRSRRGGAREHARRRGGGSSGGWLRMQRWAEVWAPPPFIREIPHSLMCNHCGFNSFSEGYLRKQKKKHTTIDTTKIVLNQSWELISFLIVSKLVFCLWLVFLCLCFSVCVYASQTLVSCDQWSAMECNTGFDIGRIAKYIVQ